MTATAVSAPLEHVANTIKVEVKLQKDTRTADLIFGSVAGFTGKIVEFPFDTVKVRLQTQPLPQPGLPPRFRGAVDCFIKTVRSEGVLGLYKGLSPPLVGSMVENSVLFVSYNHIQNLIRTYTSSNSTAPLSVQQLALAGFLSGGVVSFILTPIELVKCKLQVQDVNRLYAGATSSSTTSAPSSAKTRHNHNNNHVVTTQPPSQIHPMPKQRPPRIPFSAHPLEPPPMHTVVSGPVHYKGPIHVIAHTLRTHGIAGLYQGQFGTFLREAGGGAAWFGVYESVCRWMVGRDVNLRGKEDLSPVQLMGAGALAGMSYNGALFPADVIKSRQQTADELDAAKGEVSHKPQRRGFVQVARELYRAEGIRGFYRGCFITVARSAPTSAVIFLTYEMLSRNFSF